MNYTQYVKHSQTTFVTMVNTKDYYLNCSLVDMKKELAMECNVQLWIDDQCDETLVIKSDNKQHLEQFINDEFGIDDIEVCEDLDYFNELNIIH